ncbi:MAG: sigma-70 family RNA polymerase sigma factor [Planctomycetes bacterium]|nr:sigma-70 family RNA polymerase sigma factor [Planctomycetota bacterium]
MSKKNTSLAVDPADLVEGVIQGKAEAQDTWLRTEYPAVYRLCLGFLANHAAADDLAQDAMLHLMDRLDRWDATRPYQAWRTTVVLNLCRDQLRKQGRRQRAEGHLRLVEQQTQLPNPHDSAAGKEIRDVITRALSQLSPREREAFVLRDLEQQATDVVAAAMEVTPATVRSLLTLARRRLRGILAPALAMGPRAAGGSDG